MLWSQASLLQLHTQSLVGYSNVGIVNNIGMCFVFGVGKGLGIGVSSGGRVLYVDMPCLFYSGTYWTNQ